VVPALSNIFKQRGLEGFQPLVAHSYERVMPGKDYLDSVINNWRVYAASSEQAADACEAFLESVLNTKAFPLTRLSSMLASESAKVLENTYRTVNIAFIHEWTKFAEGVGIDLFEVINAIQKRPTHANIRYPGIGIGGYCLTKDPTFAPAAAKQLFGLSIEFPFSRLAVSQTAQMPLHALGRLTNFLGGSLNSKKILLCGVSYRQDVADTRFSPSEIIYRKLKALGAIVDLHDPFVNFWEELGVEVSTLLPSSESYNAIIFAVPHQHYQILDLSKYLVFKDKVLIFDAFSVFTAEQRKNFRHLGIRIEAVGVGDGL
jgi:UDP-N-acetyl-D-glucosamine dehydrogenase